MGKFKRIAEQDIREMRKTLDALPDKNLGKTREEAVELLNANILKALEKGYSVKELSEIMAKGNVSIPATVLRAKMLPRKAGTARKEAKKTKPIEPATPKETRTNAIKPQETPDYYTPDKEVL